MRAALFTREYPPHVYGGAGVHVDYLSRELAKKIEVEVHCWGEQNSEQGNLHVVGAQPWSEITKGTEGKFKGALEALSLNLTQIKALSDVDVAQETTNLAKWNVLVQAGTSMLTQANQSAQVALKLITG